MKKILFLILCCLAVNNTNAQVSDAYTRFTELPSGRFDGTFFVQLPALTNISGITVKLGTTESGTELLNYTFAYDVNTGLPAGYTYLRNNKDLELGIGDFSVITTVFGEVTLIDNAGVATAAFRFISN